jgi:hypothetical protein
MSGCTETPSLSVEDILSKAVGYCEQW